MVVVTKTQYVTVVLIDCVAATLLVMGSMDAAAKSSTTPSGKTQYTNPVQD